MNVLVSDLAAKSLDKVQRDDAKAALRALDMINNAADQRALYPKIRKLERDPLNDEEYGLWEMRINRNSRFLLRFTKDESGENTAIVVDFRDMRHFKAGYGPD